MEPDSPRFSLGAVAASAVLRTADRARLTALRLSGVRSRHVPTAAGRIHVLDAQGRGPLPPIVLLHGISATAADYAPLFKRLLPFTSRVVAPDLPGHGLSDAPRGGMGPRAVLGAIAETLDRVLERPAIVFGNSLGGAAALRYGLTGSNKVAGLFLVSPAGAHGDQDELDALMELLEVRDHRTAREFMRRVLPSEPWSLDLLAWGARVRLTRPAVRRLIERTSPRELLTPDELAHLTMPITLVWGDKERLLPRSHHTFFQRHLPDHTRFVSPPTFGHAPFLDQADDVAKLLRFFAVDVATGAVSPTLDYGFSAHL